MFQRDIFRDLSKLEKTVKGKKKDTPLEILEIFENVSYVMAKHADPSQPDTPEEWLDQFNTFSIYEVIPQLVDLWHLNLQTDVEAKKNLNRVAGK